MKQRVLTPAVWKVPLFWALCAVAACNCGDTRLGTRGLLQVTINSPMQGQTFGINDTIDFNATASDVAGVKDLILTVGTGSMPGGKTCPVGTSPTKIDCDFSFGPMQESANLQNGSFTLTATGHDHAGNPVKETVVVTIESLKVAFTAPTPPSATVSTPSPVAVQVESAAPLKTVTVTFDANKPLASWSNPATSMTAFSQNVTWMTMVGQGTHTLKATATDVNGNMGTAQMKVVVKCNGDSDCPSGERCCSNDGTCNKTVGLGSDCDCDHPCDQADGCFPGTCGQTPAKCRPGCNPGDQNTPAQVCTEMENGEPAWCSPTTQATTQASTQGGACAPGDSCDVVKQNCPDLPLDRSKPAGAGNPLVPYTCIPAAPGPPGVNQCIPAGKTAAGGSNCDLACGNNTTNCVKDYVCVQPLNPSQQPCGPATCQAQCSDPYDPNSDPFGGLSGPPQAPDCPQGQYCAQLLGPGFVPYATGSCTSMTPDPSCIGL